MKPDGDHTQTPGWPLGGSEAAGSLVIQTHPSVHTHAGQLRRRPPNSRLGFATASSAAAAAAAAATRLARRVRRGCRRGASVDGQLQVGCLAHEEQRRARQ